MLAHWNEESGMSKRDSATVERITVERIIANTINETARGDPDALTARVVAALAGAGYGIVPASGIEDTALGPQPFDELTPRMRPQDTYGDGRDWTFKTGEHGGDEPDNMPQTIKATDAAGRWAIYVPLTRGGKIVLPRPYPGTVSSNRAEMRPLYRSPNGDNWFLARDAMTGTAFVRHQANAPSGGQVTDMEISAFLSGPRNPEHEALLRLIGASILNPRGAKADDEPLAVNTGREWSNAEMNALGEMLVRGVSIEEIAHRLRRDRDEVRDKVAEVGRACR
jgi:hypothetical protein